MTRKEALKLLLDLTSTWGTEACFEPLAALGVSREEFDEAVQD